MSTLIDRQIDLEHLGITEGVKRYMDNVKANGITSVGTGERAMGAMLPRLADAIVEFCNTDGSKAARRGRALPYLVQCDPTQAAYLTVRYATDAAGSEEKVRFSTVAVRIGVAIEEHLNLLKLAEESPGLYRKVMEQVKTNSAAHMRRGVLRHVVAKYGKAPLKWSMSIRGLIGAKLLDLLADLEEREEDGILRKVLVRRPDCKETYLELNDWARERIERGLEKNSMWYPVHMPMLVPPRAWQMFSKPEGATWDKRGGYITDQMARFQLGQARSKEQLRLLDANPPVSVLTAVNSIQSTPWRINKALYAVIKEAWVSGEKFQALLVEADKVLPPRPPGIDATLATTDMTPDQRELMIVWKKDASEVHQFNARNKSKRVAITKKMWVADKYAEEEAFYFPHYVDFRGRIYPFASYLNPQSDDSGRAMLEFAQGKPLGEHGLFWLKVHVANLFGVDKVSFADRVKWVDEHMEELNDSATSPLDGGMLWISADSPWCALAACMELTGAIVAGEDYVSRLPIAMDGSCSGLQHYSAMLRDPVGGAAVNLVPAVKPADLYTQVAVRSQSVVDRSTCEMASLWKGKVTRKIVKQPTMTLCYSATLYGMQQQIEKAVRDLGGEDYLLTEDLRGACVYLAGVVWTAIGDTVIAARDAMAFLKKVAALTSEADVPVRWTAPSGFTVVQDYRMEKATRVSCHYQGARVQFNLAESGDERDPKRQAAGVAPNFVHSLDSAHLMATVNLGMENDLYDWACIHDSFGVHASDVDTLHACIREAFIEQYTPDLLAKLRTEIVDQLKLTHPTIAEQVPHVPAKGSLDLDAVRESAYFFA